VSTHKAIVFSFLDRYASLALNIVSSMIIARLLTPDQIGVFSVTMVLLAFLSTVRDLGAGEYLVQEKELTTARVQAVWAVQLGLGLILALVVLLAAYPVAAFYREPQMKNIMLVIAANYAINPFGSLTYAYLVREMRFDSIALIRFSGTLIGTLVSVILAWQGFGPISLALGMFATTLVSALTSVYFRPKSFPWLPGTAELGRVLSFGSKLTSTTLMNVVGTNTPELLLGKLQDMVAVGYYSRSGGLVAMFSRLISDPITTVALSWFSRQRREQGHFTESFLKATSYISALGWTFCLALILLAHPVTRVLYGAQWDASVNLTRILAAGYLFATPVGLATAALMAAGQATRLFTATAIATAVTILLAALGANAGLTLLAWAMTAAAAVSTGLWLYMAQVTVNFRWLDLVKALSGSAMVAAVSAIAPLAVFVLWGPTPTNSLIALILGGVGSAAGFVVGVIVVRHPMKEELAPMWAKFSSKLKPN
jgi:O-antigen/teichoic acid export membrane protein